MGYLTSLKNWSEITRRDSSLIKLSTIHLWFLLLNARHYFTKLACSSNKICNLAIHNSLHETCMLTDLGWGKGCASEVALEKCSDQKLFLKVWHISWNTPSECAPFHFCCVLYESLLILIFFSITEILSFSTQLILKTCSQFYNSSYVGYDYHIPLCFNLQVVSWIMKWRDRC